MQQLTLKHNQLTLSIDNITQAEAVVMKYKASAQMLGGKKKEAVMAQIKTLESLCMQTRLLRLELIEQQQRLIKSQSTLTTLHQRVVSAERDVKDLKIKKELKLEK